MLRRSRLGCQIRVAHNKGLVGLVSQGLKRTEYTTLTQYGTRLGWRTVLSRSCLPDGAWTMSATSRPTSALSLLKWLVNEGRTTMQTMGKRSMTTCVGPRYQLTRELSIEWSDRHLPMRSQRLLTGRIGSIVLPHARPLFFAPERPIPCLRVCGGRWRPLRRLRFGCAVVLELHHD